MEMNALVNGLGAINEKGSREEKEQLVKNVASLLDAPLENSQNLNFAQEILRTLASDAEESVRHTLAAYMRSNPQLPKDVALQLANDIESISLPILESCSLINEQELLDIIANSDSAAKQIAIAKREDVTENISAALVEHAKDETVVTTLLENHLAPVSTALMHTIAAKQSDSTAVMTALAQREAVPVELLQRMTTDISDRIRAAMLAKIQNKYGLSEHQLQSLSDHGTAISVLKILDNRPSLFDARALVHNLIETRRMNPGIFLTALLMGKRHFVKYCIAELSKQPFSSVEKLLAAEDMSASFEEILDTADLLPTFAMDIFEVLKFLETTTLKTTYELVHGLFDYINANPDRFPNGHYFRMTLQSQPAFQTPE